MDRLERRKEENDRDSRTGYDNEIFGGNRATRESNRAHRPRNIIALGDRAKWKAVYTRDKSKGPFYWNGTKLIYRFIIFPRFIRGRPDKKWLINADKRHGQCGWLKRSQQCGTMLGDQNAFFVERARSTVLLNRSHKSSCTRGNYKSEKIASWSILSPWGDNAWNVFRLRRITAANRSSMCPVEYIQHVVHEQEEMDYK